MKVGKLHICIAVLVMVYLANCFSPFRLSNDTVKYFILMEKWEGVWPADMVVKKDFLPYGYVFFLIALSKLNMLHSFVIALCQFIYLTGVFLFINKIFKETVNIRVVVFFLLLNWLTMKFVLLPLSEMQFLFFSIGTLYHYEQFERNNKIRSLAYAGVFCAVSIFTRTAGIVLLPALGLAALLKNRRQIAAWFTKNKTLSFLIPSILAIAFVSILWTSSYFEYVRPALINDPLHYSANCFVNHLTDWAEIFINVPFSKVSTLLPALPCKILYISIGLFFLFILLYGLVKGKFAIALHIRIYLILYLALIFNWPFFDARFWFPVLPLIFAVLLQKRNIGLVKILKAAYIISGIFAISYYSYLSLDKHALANRHDAGKWKAEYEAVFFNERDEHSIIDQRALYILQKYD